MTCAFAPPNPNELTPAMRSAVPFGNGSSWVGTVDLGLTYALTKNIQLDAGVNIGVTRAADDWNPFVGISFRF